MVSVSAPPWDPRARPDVAILIALPEEFETLAEAYAERWHPQPNPDFHGSDFLFEGPGGYRCVATIRGPMPLFLANVHLTRARLFRSCTALAHAKTLLEQLRAKGYRRHDEMLADAEAAATHWPTPPTD